MNPSPGLRPPSPRQAGRGQGEGTLWRNPWSQIVLWASLVGIGTLTLAGAEAGADAASVEFDFTKPGVAQEWRALSDIAALEPSGDGLVVKIRGPDPYFVGPPRNFPTGVPLRLHLRLKSDLGGAGQVFYFREGATEDKSVHFFVPAGKWMDVRLRLPPLGPGYRFRIDPPGNGGQAVFSGLRVLPSALIEPPSWPVPVIPQIGNQTVSVRSGPVELVQDRSTFGSFEVRVHGKRMSANHNRPLIGYRQDGRMRWFAFAAESSPNITVRETRGGIGAKAVCTDPDGARWEVEHRFWAAATPGSINVEVRVTVDQERSVMFLPMLVLLPGAGSFGEGKKQAVFAGLEYLENEPSSSEADVKGAAARRQVPDNLKITFPVAAIVADGRYIGLIWDKGPQFSVLFDSPDRIFQSHGHVMGLLFPGSDEDNREEGNLLPYDPEPLPANRPLVLRATIVGGAGQSAVPAVQHYVRLKGLPALPKAPSFSEYVALAGGGWLDSAIREDNLYRHAVWPGFGAQPAADAAYFMEWLAANRWNRSLGKRLNDAARSAVARVKPEALNQFAIGHVRYPVAALVFGDVEANAKQAEVQARNLLGRFEPDGSIRYRKNPTGLDYGKTHGAPDANGLTAPVVAGVLEAAAFSGNRDLIELGLQRLRNLDKFRNTVPRGAQTWEVPLHTPDILASAHLVRAYLLGYELTGEPYFLEQARYWAWTGVPFVYLVPPTPQPVGVYNTIPVFGATSWENPVWFGRPVQWCGMVYAEALYRLAFYDQEGPWAQLGDGITSAGLQHTWPESDPERQGLLPDYFELRPQLRNGPAINPGTVQAGAVHLFHQTPLYEFHAFRAAVVLVHAPGRITPMEEKPQKVRFRVQGWPAHPYYVLVSGLKQTPRVKVDGRPVVLGDPHQWQAAEGRLILRLEKNSIVELAWD